MLAPILLISLSQACVSEVAAVRLGGRLRTLGLDAVATLTVSLFYARHFALHLQLAVGGALWVTAGGSTLPFTDIRGRPERVSDFLSPEARLAMGVAF